MLVAFKGFIVRYPRRSEVAVTSRDGLLIVSGGQIVACADVGDAGFAETLALACRAQRVVELGATELLVPGFVDAHSHAPQHAFVGTGLDLPLLDWLNTYTFPYESRFGNADYARRVYDGVVRRQLRNGSTTTSYFGTIHMAGTLELVDACQRLGQRAHVGKVSMDSNAPDYYVEEGWETAAAASADFVRAVKARGSTLVTPSVVPRFAPSCSSQLLEALGTLSSSEDPPLPVHTHLSENRAECDWVAALFPEARCYVDVYARAGLLHSGAYFAHCCHCGTLERDLVRTANAKIVHCPTSNFVVGRALCDVRQWLDDGVQVGLGTDVAGGWATSMLDAARHAVVTSRLVAEREADPRKALTWAEALILATSGGGNVLRIQIGEFRPGYHFDALVVDAALSKGPIDVFDLNEAPLAMLEKFFWNGDDRNIRDVYVAGRRVAGSRTPPSRRPILAAIAALAALAVFLARR